MNVCVLFNLNVINSNEIYVIGDNVLWITCFVIFLLIIVVLESIGELLFIYVFQLVAFLSSPRFYIRHSEYKFCESLYTKAFIPYDV